MNASTREQLIADADDLLNRLFPLHRSLAGEANRTTLAILRDHMPDLQTIEVPSGTKAYDWTVPPEWKVKRAYIKEDGGSTICDIKNSNLHVVSFSQPVHKLVDLNELKQHLHWHDQLVEAIPYVTSYYKEYWGFCLAKNKVDSLKDVPYEVCIDAEFVNGSMSYGDIVIPGKSPREILFSTYICHPSMANNELSGPVLQILLAKYLQGQDLNFTYRFLFMPETIGSIYYISQNLDRLRSKVMAVFCVTCVGDAGDFSYLSSRNGATYADRLIQHAAQAKCLDLVQYSWLERGSDERQYGAPTIDLPVASLMRTKYGVYPEYHTSLDNLDLVNGINLVDTLELYLEMVRINEQSTFYRSTYDCEPMLSPKGLYPSISNHQSAATVYNLLNILSFADGLHSQHDIAVKTSLPVQQVLQVLTQLEAADVLTDVSLACIGAD